LPPSAAAGMPKRWHERAVVHLLQVAIPARECQISLDADAEDVC
jgi:hypothetical protein